MSESKHGVRLPEPSDWASIWKDKGICLICGAIVHTVNLEVHLKWHDELG